MTDQRRLIQDATPGELRHRLLRAGREAAPTAESRQRLLGAVLPLMDTPTLDAAASKASLKAAASSLKASMASKLAVLSVVGAAATGMWYTVGERGADDPSSAAAPTQLARSPRFATPTATATEPAVAAPGAIAVPALQTDASASALQAPLPRVEPPAAPAHRAATEPRRPPRHPSRQRLAGVARNSTLPPTPELAPAQAPLGSEALREARTQPTQAARPQPQSATPGVEPADARAAKGRAPSSPEDTALREELRQLDVVRDALRRGDSTAAQQRVESYFERFPHGFLEPEARRLAQEARAMSAH